MIYFFITKGTEKNHELGLGSQCNLMKSEFLINSVLGKHKNGVKKTGKNFLI